MPEESKAQTPVSPEIQEAIRNLVSAIRAVKLYPPNNPIYAQSLHKSFESLDSVLQNVPDISIGVQKTYFLYEDAPVGKEAQLNRTIAQDLFAKGIRELIFLQGLAEEELLALCQALALTSEDMAMRSGIVSILWEHSVMHIRVTEAMLEEVITTGATKRLSSAQERPSSADDDQPVKLEDTVAGRELHFKGRTLLLGEMVDDPKTFGAKMLEIAQQTVQEGQTVEERLHELYREAGRTICEADENDQEALFRGLARSVMEMEEKVRGAFVSSKLYAHLDAERLREQAEAGEDRVPEELHEIVTGRFSQEWNVQHIASLLKRSALQQGEPEQPRARLSEAEVAGISEETIAIARELGEYTADEMESLRAMGEMGTESDITEAALRTLIFLLPMVKNEHRPGPPDQETGLFAGVVHQLETMLAYLLKNKEYDLATLIVRAFHLPVDPAFRARLAEASQKAADRDAVRAVVADMRSSAKGSPEYRAAYSYLAVLDQQAIAVLLEALAGEKDRAIRRYLIDILKDLGKSQIARIGERIDDPRWFVVRNVVHILGESRSEEALPYLERVIGHKQSQIRHEVIKGLISIGGKRAAAMLIRLLNDKEPDIQLLALRGLGAIHGAGAEEARSLQGLLQGRSLNKKENVLTIEGFRVLARIGDAETVTFLERYDKRRWWRSRRLQEELRSAARSAIDTIQRRLTDGGRAS